MPQYRVLSECSINGRSLSPGDTLTYGTTAAEVAFLLQREDTLTYNTPGTTAAEVAFLLQRGYIEPVAAPIESEPEEEAEDLIEYWTLREVVLGYKTFTAGEAFVYNPVTQKLTCALGVWPLDHSKLAERIADGSVSNQPPLPPTKTQYGDLEITIHNGPAPFIDIPKLLVDPEIQSRLERFKADQGRLTLQLTRIEQDLTTLDNEIKLVFPGTRVDPTLALASTPLRNAILDVLTARVLELRGQRADVRKQIDTLTSEAQAFFKAKILGGDRPHEDSYLLSDL